MTTRRRIDGLLVIAAIVGGYLGASATPRSVPEPTAYLPPADVSRAEAGTSVPGPSGAPQVRTPEPTGLPRQGSDGGGAPTTRPSARPTAAVTPRRSARPTLAPRATDNPTSTKRIARRTGDRLAGYASWYGTGGPGLYAAMHDYRDGTRVTAVVCAFPGGHATCITVPVVTECGACRWAKGATLIDLSVLAFRALGVPLEVGLVKVTVEVVE